ncbi:MAG: RluA family pseudouridine synthase [Chloroflexota bacterium]|nr:RluA family pseudouridine synthase [Chloroflexota bacterium]
MAGDEQQLELNVEIGGERIDRFLADRLADVSRAEIQRWIKAGKATVNGRSVKASYKLSAGEAVSLQRPPVRSQAVQPEAIPLAIVYEDDDLVVVDKPAGLVVHPAPGHSGGTLVNGLLARYPGLGGEAGPERAGIVHRLDRDTSGLIVVARTPEALQALQSQFRARTVQKSYLALAEGIVAVPEGRVEAPVGRDPVRRKRMAVVSEKQGGRAALTTFQVLGLFQPRISPFRVEMSLLELGLHTGRTHQIRVHLAFIKHPVVGDRVYGRRKQRIHCPRQFLHAARLQLVHPTTGERLAFESPLPADLEGVLGSLAEIG